MSTALARRLRQLEQELEDLRDIFENMTSAEHRSLTDAWVMRVIRAGLVPPPDPSCPYATIEALRHTHRDELRALQQTIAGQAWQREHRTMGMALFLRELQRVACAKNG